jgi:oligopeptide/dipeptide ABC transporter ATP-binding protein
MADTPVRERPLLDVRDLVKVFPLPGGGRVRAVDGVSITVRRGETFGLVGESGSGKSTVGRCVLRLLSGDSGSVLFDGQDIGGLSPARMRRLRSRIQVVFQDPHGSLNRGQVVREIIGAPLKAHGMGSRRERAARVEELLGLVQLPGRFGERRPRELSGGQAQRVAIARALALRPEFVVLDEAVSALDVSVRAQILNLLSGLQSELGLTYLFISHDLAVVRYMAQEVAVMYRGRIVERARREELFSAPRHPYTRLLLEAVPVADPASRDARGNDEGKREAVEPDVDVPQGGCRFLPRCVTGTGRGVCASQDPILRQIGEPPVLVACHYPGAAE